LTRTKTTETESIQRMIDRRLKDRLVGAAPSAEHHLDEDAICAFVEGRLDEAEAAPVVLHLTECSLCRRATAQLVRLESQFETENESTAMDQEPGQVRRFLDRLSSSLAPSIEEDAVFAYQEPAAADQDTEAKTDSRTEKSEHTD
jgi:anti-sigma factor RsiW